MFGLGSQEILVILLILFILFGAKRIPELARSLGQGMKEFRNTIKESTDGPMKNG
jgi:sec-independent protein translocase protein TatA